MNAFTSQWSAAYEPWAAARREERRYDADVWMPGYEAKALTDHMHKEMDRLSEVRCKLEDRLLSVPALNAAQLATKVLVAFDNGREADVWMCDILRDCRRFADDSLTRGDLSEGLGATAMAGNHRGWMAEHSAALDQARSEPEDDAPSLNRALALEALILAVPAVTDDDVIARLVMIASEVASGGAPPVDAARTVLREAIAHLGLGTTADFERPSVQEGEA